MKTLTKKKISLGFTLFMSIGLFLYVFIPSITSVGELREASSITVQVPLFWCLLFFAIWALGLCTGIDMKELQAEKYPIPSHDPTKDYKID